VGVAMLAVWLLVAAFSPSLGGGSWSTAEERAPSGCSAVGRSGEHLVSPSRLVSVAGLEFGVHVGEDEPEHRDDVCGPRCRLFGAVVRRLPASRGTASESRSSEEQQRRGAPSTRLVRRRRSRSPEGPFCNFTLFLDFSVRAVF
jgi:hypothetical protein